MKYDSLLKSLYKAISSVAKECIISEFTPIDDSNVEMVERSFAYELYHQWSLVLLDYKQKNPEADNLRLNGEIPKHIAVNKLVFPDIVLHGGHIAPSPN